MDRLREALEDAARLVVEGKVIQWCLEHRAEGVPGYEMCGVVWVGPPQHVPCRMVVRLLTEVPE